MTTASTARVWLRRIAAVVLVYFAWGIGYDLLADTVWVGVSVSVIGGALAGWVAASPRWPVVAAVVAAGVDTVGAFFVAADAPGGNDLIQRALSLVLVLIGVLIWGMVARRLTRDRSGADAG